MENRLVIADRDRGWGSKQETGVSRCKYYIEDG